SGEASWRASSPPTPRRHAPRSAQDSNPGPWGFLLVGQLRGLAHRFAAASDREPRDPGDACASPRGRYHHGAPRPEGLSTTKVIHESSFNFVDEAPARPP